MKNCTRVWRNTASANFLYKFAAVVVCSATFPTPNGVFFVFSIQYNESNLFRDEVKAEAATEKEESVEKEKVSQDTEVKSETKAKEGDKKDQKKDVKTEDKKDEKKDTKQVKKEEPAKKPAVKKENEKKTEKKAETKDEKKADEKKSAADAKKSAADAKKGGTDAKKKETGKSLWVSNLSSMTRAADLKTRFSQYGKVCMLLLSLKFDAKKNPFCL